MKYSDIIEDLRSAPFVRLLLPLAVGIIFQIEFLPIRSNAVFACLALFFLMLLAKRFVTSYSRRWCFGLLVHLFLFFAGVALVQNLKQHSQIPTSQKISLLALVVDEPSDGERFAKLSVKVKSYEDSAKNWHSVNEKMLLYLRVDTLTTLPKLGDEIMVRVSLSSIPPPKNPYEFNYAGYLQQRGIFASAFVNPDSYTIVSSNNIPAWKIFPKNVRKAALTFFIKQGISGEEFAVLQALTLGDKSLLDSDLRQSYSAAGAMHILAVSGMHVGIIAMILGFFMKPMEKRKHGKIIRGVIILLFLWSYALVAGFSASVLRATIMFSVLTVGTMLNRATNTYNTLAFSAFILCLADPLCLFNAGFQLSYSAVLGILFFQPRIRRLLHFKHKIFQWTWDLVCVSVAANIGTFPITIFLFSQFPLYFILTNILVTIPTTAIMGGFLASLALCWVPGLRWLLVMFTKYSIVVINFFIRLVESLPHSLIEGLWLTPLQTWFLLLSLTLLAFFMWSKRTKMFTLALLCLLATFVLRTTNLYARTQQKVMVVYSVKNASLVTFVNGTSGFALCDSADLLNNFDFNVKTHLTSLGFSGLKSIPKIALQNSDNEEFVEHGICKGFVKFLDKTVKVVCNETLCKPHEPLAVDYLILTSQCRLRPEQLLEIYRPQHFIIDASVSARDAGRFKRALSERNISYHSVRDKGAFIQSF